MKKFMILICLFSLVVFSCKKGIDTNAGSDLTTLSMSESGINALNKDLRDNQKITTSLNYVKLQIDPDSQNCTQIAGKKFEIKEGKFQDQADITLKAKTCTYTLNMEYGTDSKPYYSGETTIGPNKANPYGSNGKTLVKIELSFNNNPNSKIKIEAGELSPETTDVEINPMLVDSNTAQLKDLINPKCTYINDVPLLTSSNSIDELAILVRKNNASDCINTSWLEDHNFKENPNKGSDVGPLTDPQIHVNTNNLSLTNNATYSLMTFMFHSDEKIVLRRSYETFDPNEKSIIIVIYDFQFKSNQSTYSFGQTRGYTKAVSFIKK